MPNKIRLEKHIRVTEKVFKANRARELSLVNQAIDTQRHQATPHKGKRVQKLAPFI